MKITWMSLIFFIVPLIAMEKYSRNLELFNKRSRDCFQAQRNLNLLGIHDTSKRTAQLAQALIDCDVKVSQDCLRNSIENEDNIAWAYHFVEMQVRQQRRNPAGLKYRQIYAAFPKELMLSAVRSAVDQVKDIGSKISES